jgi:hypothetical protein
MVWPARVLLYLDEWFHLVWIYLIRVLVLNSFSESSIMVGWTESSSLVWFNEDADLVWFNACSGFVWLIRTSCLVCLIIGQMQP